MTSITANVPIRGDLCIIRRDAYTKKVISVWEKKNVITYGATTKLLHLLAPNTALGATIQEQSQIKSIRLGTDRSAPSRSDSDLASEAADGVTPVRRELTDADRVMGPSGVIDFIAVVGPTEANGITFREAGLFTRGTANDPQVTTGAVMFSRQVFPDTTKDPTIELEFRWRITFSV